MSLRLERHRQSLQRRMIASSGVFAIFMIVAAVAGVQGTSRRDDILLALIVLLVGSFVLLPRNAIPSRWPSAESAEAEDRLELMRETLIGLQNRATYQRFFYLAIALLLVVVLPLMGI